MILDNKSMFRYKMIIEYDGSFFCGWQYQQKDEDIFSSFSGEKDQKNLEKKLFFCRDKNVFPSVQGTLENALFKMTGMPILVEGAGRTDAGVHAFAQAAHFDLPKFIEPFKLLTGINFYIKNWGAIVVHIETVDKSFHARFSALSREYVYKIVNRRMPLALDYKRAWYVSEPLDTNSMKKAAKDFLGKHNFNAFRASACQSKDPVKTVDKCEIFVQEEKIEFYVKARSFLHHQVRIMMGTLVWIGKGKMPLSTISALLESGDRRKAGPTAPPQGLYFLRVNYLQDAL